MRGGANLQGHLPAELEAQGYEKTDWGVTIAENRADYADDLFCGYTDQDAANGIPPVYLVPLNLTILENSGITNGYGFQNN